MRGSQDLDRIASQVWDDMSITPAERVVAEPIVRRVASRQKDIDAELAEVTTNWRLERMSWVDRNLLRLACFELAHRHDTPARVVLNEAIEIARKFSSPESAQFINGVLDSVARELQST